MNTALVWNNLVAYSLQIGLLVGVASLVPVLLRLALPKARLAYWQLLLVACLVLPLTRPWKQAIVTVSTPAAVVPMAPAAPAKPVPMPKTHWAPGEIGLLVLAAGALARLGWLAVGLWKLRRYRRHSTPWRGEAVTLGPRPEYRISEEIGSPVTFGLRQPMVLLPRNFDQLAPAMRDAVLCHEALHVERRDWAFTVAEELVRAVFWFHPAIWWLLGEIQLAREQAVDREVVERTQARDEYVDTLLAVAGARLELDLAPAPLFLRRRHLRQRVIAVVQEVRMSKTRLISTLTAGLALLAAACWLVTAAFPLAAEPQVVADGAGVTVEMNGAQLMHRAPVRYPAEAIAKSVQGTVVAQVRLGADGTVVDASVLSGPDELRKAVLQSVLSWHFVKDLGGSTQTVTVNFQLPPQETAVAAAVRPSPELHRGAVQAALNALRVAGINVRGLSDQARADLLAALPVHVGDSVSSETLAKTTAAVRAFDEHLSVGFRTTPNGEITVSIAAPESAASASPGAAVAVSQNISLPTPKAEAPGMPARVQIGANVAAAALIYGPKPVYPPLAKQAKISGVVHLHAFISADGGVQSLAVIPPAHPLLAPAAMEAVRQWRYKPTMLNGEPVEVETTIDVSFILAED
jgi:TonB family protein